jgi:hypothetical protein
MSYYKLFQSICQRLFKPVNGDDDVSVFDPTDQFKGDSDEPAKVARRLNAAFLTLLAGQKHPDYKKARSLLHQTAESTDGSEIARFYLAALDRIHKEIENVCIRNQDFAGRMKHLASFLEKTPQEQIPLHQTENIWSVFFPEGLGLFSDRDKSVSALREKRRVNIQVANPEPIVDAARQILFTSNVLLTLPPASEPYDALHCSEALKQNLRTVSEEPQRYWYDHPIHMGVKPPNNELLYGLRGLAEALKFEHERGSVAKTAKITCLLSVSVTHQGLHETARPYIDEVLSHAGFLKNLDVYLFTETDTQKIISEILAPSALHFLQYPDLTTELTMFGVDGEYGRHYSFLKAIAAFWNVFIDPHVKATFKIDLDQIFPQQALVEQTGASAFEHFTTALWGATGTDSRGRPVELGMIAGALVNESDIDNSLFTPDIRFPKRSLLPDERLFFSVLPQAISTQAEMMTRYNTRRFDEVNTCIQRVHVTGGTNGIRIDSLRRHRPFTPSFIGRAEDQAYLLSAIKRVGKSLAYVHKDGLIMRHDKEAFAREAIESAEIGRIVGDYVRMLYLTTYAGVLSAGKTELKEILDPFTGCFISIIPTTVALLRFSLRAALLFRENQMEKGLELVTIGAQQILKAFKFIRGENSELKRQYDNERRGWNVYYDTLDAVEQALKNKDPFALGLQQKAKIIIRKCAVSKAHRASGKNA